MLKTWCVTVVLVFLFAGCGNESNQWAPAPDESIGSDIPSDSFVEDESSEQSHTVSCTVGEQRECYSGPEATRGVGICAPGTQICEGAVEFQSWSACAGEALPVTAPTEETCSDGLDNDCNGVADDESECPYDEEYSSCGDGVCSEDESYRTCPDDCPDDGSVPTCGDGACTHLESSDDCPQDCPEDGSYCGDGECNGTETSENCPEDCGGGDATCGDGACNGGETAESCPDDCEGETDLPEQYEVWLISAEIDMSDWDCEGIWSWLGNECDFEADVYLGGYHADTDEDEDAQWNAYLFTVPTSLLTSQPMELVIEDNDSFLTLSDDGMGSCYVQATAESLEAGQLVSYCGGDIDTVLFQFVPSY